MERRSAKDFIYGTLAPLYELVCGALLQRGRRRALSMLGPRPGERILEVGVGTGCCINDYPSSCHVVAVDLSREMVSRAARRVDEAHRERVAVIQMDAHQLAFPDGVFDAVYVPHTINVVDDPIAVGRELVRVCTPRGRIILLNHFDGIPETSNVINTMAGVLASAADVNWHLDLRSFLRAVNLRLVAVESVNVPRLSSIVVTTTE